jgi:signal transduction histidine kinase
MMALTLALFTLALAALALGVVVMTALRLSRKRDELAEELRATRTRMQTLAELLDVWSWRSDADHRVIAMQPPHGAATSDWSGAPLPQPIWERFSAEHAVGLRAQLTSGAVLHDVPVMLGERRRALLRGRPVRDAQGLFAGYQGTLREIAATAAAVPIPHAGASTIAAAPSVATRAVSGASDHDTFSFTVSHDLRAPIRVVEGFTKIVKEDYGRLLDRVGNDHLDRVLGAAARMNNMIDALLALSKLSSQPLARQPVNLSQLAGFVADDLRRQWPDHAVQIAIEPDMQVQGDPTLLRVVIENLLGNAWKYTGKTSGATVSFRRHERDPDVFSVIDNGAGFDMRFSDRLFGVFQRLHSANDFPGTGVGLASVRRIMRRHGGEVWGEGEVNRGARFHFSLPPNAQPL